MKNNISPKEILVSLMVGCVPEREDEIISLWEQYNPDVIFLDDSKQITLNATGKRIVLNAKTIDVFWLIGFCGWRAIESYSPYVVCSIKSGQSILELIKSDDELDDYERIYKERLAAAQAFINADDYLSAPWPPDIPRPNYDRNVIDDPQYKATFDLSLLAVGFTIFHEFHHVMLDQSNKRPEDRREEELACDVWAREFITVKLAAYCKSHNHNYHEVLRKRSMGFAIASLILHEITPRWEHGGNCEYFSVTSRLETIIDNTSLPDNDVFWVFVASLLIGVSRQKGMLIDVNAPTTSAKSLARHLLNKL